MNSKSIQQTIQQTIKNFSFENELSDFLKKKIDSEAINYVKISEIITENNLAYYKFVTEKAGILNPTTLDNLISHLKNVRTIDELNTLLMIFHMGRNNKQMGGRRAQKNFPMFGNFEEANTNKALDELTRLKLWNAMNAMNSLKSKNLILENDLKKEQLRILKQKGTKSTKSPKTHKIHKSTKTQKKSPTKKNK